VYVKDRDILYRLVLSLSAFELTSRPMAVEKPDRSAIEERAIKCGVARLRVLLR
jgi:hypothetical protein